MMNELKVISVSKMQSNTQVAGIIKKNKCYEMTDLKVKVVSNPLYQSYERIK